MLRELWLALVSYMSQVSEPDLIPSSSAALAMTTVCPQQWNLSPAVVIRKK